jgi:cell division septum initiation protein DivIVA
VAYLDDLREKIERLKQLQQKQLEELDELKKSILEKAFQGELVKS